MFDMFVGVIKYFLNYGTKWVHKTKEEKRLTEADAWLKMEQELNALEGYARRAYRLIFASSALEIEQNKSNEKYPFVFKLASFPQAVPNAISKNYGKMLWKQKQQVRSAFHEYLNIWHSCINRFPDGEPDLLSLHKQFEKTAKLFALALEIKKSD